MKILLHITSLSFFINFLVVQSAHSQDYKSSVVTDPSISRRCEALLAKRNEKVQHKQKISALINRNRKLQRIAPVRKKTARKRLTDNHSSLKRELHLTLTKITHLEENIVRRGCPGITL